jgi:hypothetical protein
MRRAVAFAGVLVAAVLLVSAHRAASDTWAGDRYAWRSDGEAVQATTDGGAHWKVIYDPGEDFWNLAQTAPGVGVVASGGPQAVDLAWTITNGRRWYLLGTDSVNQDGLQGHGHFLFYLSDLGPSGSQVHEITPWPPQGKYVRCSAHGLDTNAAGGPTCTNPSHPLSNRVVATLRDGTPNDIENIPGGVAVLFAGRPAAASAPLYRVLVRRNGKSVLAALPTLTPAREQALALDEGAGLRVDWPTLEVTATSSLDANHPTGATATWLSVDGGHTWEILQQATTSLG